MLPAAIGAVLAAPASACDLHAPGDLVALHHRFNPFAAELAALDRGQGEAKPMPQTLAPQALPARITVRKEDRRSVNELAAAQSLAKEGQPQLPEINRRELLREVSDTGSDPLGSDTSPAGPPVQGYLAADTQGLPD